MTKQVVNIGTVAGDKTGTKLRAGGDIINDNFTELYDRVDDLELVTATPVCGSKYPEFRQSVKYFVTKELYSSDLFYISKINNSTAGHVIVEVSKTNSLSAAGTVVLSSDRTTTARTGWEIIALSAANSSGLFGIIIIDWDKLNAATVYTCATWVEGGIYVINTVKAATSPTGGGGANTETLTTTTADVNGSKDLYIIDVAAADKVIVLDDWADIAGVVKLKSISTDDVVITMKNTGGTETFDGQNYPITLSQFGHVEIYPTATNEFILTGTGYIINTP